MKFTIIGLLLFHSAMMFLIGMVVERKNPPCGIQRLRASTPTHSAEVIVEYSTCPGDALNREPIILQLSHLIPENELRKK